MTIYSGDRDIPDNFEKLYLLKVFITALISIDLMFNALSFYLTKIALNYFCLIGALSISVID